jgi:hypothetical protein
LGVIFQETTLQSYIHYSAHVDEVVPLAQGKADVDSQEEVFTVHGNNLEYLEFAGRCYLLSVVNLGRIHILSSSTQNANHIIY